MTRAIPVRTLTIFLVKEQVGATEIIDPEEAAQCTETPVSLCTRQVGTLFAKQTPATPPGWVKFLSESVAQMPQLRRALVAAAFVTRSGMSTVRSP
jgi:hypothetical protein